MSAQTRGDRCWRTPYCTYPPDLAQMLKPDDQVLDEVRESMRRAFSGTSNAHRPLSFTIDPRELEEPDVYPPLDLNVRPRAQGWERTLREDFEDRDRNRWWRGLPQKGAL